VWVWCVGVIKKPGKKKILSKRGGGGVDCSAKNKKRRYG